MDSIITDSEGTSGTRTVTRGFLFTKMQEQDLPDFDAKLIYLERYILSQDEYCEEQKKEIKHNFSRLKTQFKKKWIESHKKARIFIQKNDEWLKETYEIPRAKNLSSGRPSKSFEDSSERSKRRKTLEMRSTIEKDLLIHAAQTSLQTSGERTASNILKDITNSPEKAQAYKKAYEITKQDSEKQLDVTAALSMFVEAGLSRRQYELVRYYDKRTFPSYKMLQQAKKTCYPAKEAYQITETCAEINLQALLDHTIQRLATYLEDVLKELSPEERQSITLISKWGCDGSQQAQYKQKLQDRDGSDSNVFQSSFVPLQLVCGQNKKVIWRNPIPSSPRFCRPMRIRFVKESVDITKSEIAYIEGAINSLKQSEFTLGGMNISTKYVMVMTMVDAKVCNAATDTTSTMRCYICGATSKDFNNLSIKKPVDSDALQFGLSVLHARIRFLESILHLSYKIPVEKWQIRLDSDKEIVKQKKAQIQAQLREKMGLIVDVPKAGFGNTNDGNTSREFFDHPETVAEITGVDLNLIKRLKVILEVITSTHKVDLKKFADYGYDTAKLYIELYPWHPMSPTMHKILIHGATVMDHALLPIGLLSEEAAEARNKHFRQYRQYFARKCSRENCNYDVLNRLLLSSDPLISSIRPKPKRKNVPHSKEAMEMLISAEPNTAECSDEESEPEQPDTDELSSGEDTWDKFDSHIISIIFLFTIASLHA